MQPITLGKRDDFGPEYYVQVFKGRRYSLLQASFGYSPMCKWRDSPYILLSAGCGTLFSSLLILGKLSWALDLLSHNWYPAED